MKLPYMKPIKTLSRAKYMTDGPECQAIAASKLSCAGLGNKAPRRGHPRCRYCPLCTPNTFELDEHHAIMECTSTVDTRERLGLTEYINKMQVDGLSSKDVFLSYVHGLDSDGDKVDIASYLKRGQIPSQIYKEWLQKCYPTTDTQKRSPTMTAP